MICNNCKIKETGTLHQMAYCTTNCKICYSEIHNSTLQNVFSVCESCSKREKLCEVCGKRLLNIICK